MSTRKTVSYRMVAEGGGQFRAELIGVGAEGERQFQRIAKGAKSAAESASVFERQIENEARAFSRLKASVDPAFAALQRIEATQRQVNEAVRLGVATQREADAVMAQVTAQTRHLAAANELVDRSGRAGGQGMRNLMLQLNQVGQQAMVTGDVLGAVAVQAPDIFAGFGGMPALIAGAAISLTSMLIPSLLSSRAEAQGLAADIESAYSATKSAIEAARQAQDRYSAAISLSGAMQSQITPQILSALKMEAVARASIVETQKEVLSVQREIFREQLATNKAALQGKIDSALASNAQVRRGQREDDDVTQRVLDANRELVLEIKQQELQLKLVGAQINQNYGEAADMVDELIKANREGSNLSAVFAGMDLSGVGGQAAFLAQQMGVAATEAVRYNAALNRGAGVADSSGAAKGLSFGLDAVEPTLGLNAASTRLKFGDLSRPPLRTVVPLASAPSSRGGGGGGGGGAASAQKDLNDQVREAERIFRSTRTAHELYTESLAKADALLDKGLITYDTYTRHVEDLRAQYDKSKQAMQEYGLVASSVKDAVIDGLMGQKNAAEQLAQSLKRAALEYALFGTGSFAQKGSTFTGLLGGVFGNLLSFDGGGHTPSGPRSGGLDGRGGFMALLHPNEAVIDNTRGSGGAGGATLRVALDDGLRASIVEESVSRSGQLSVQLIQSANARQDRALAGRLDAFDVRGV